MVVMFGPDVKVVVVVVEEEDDAVDVVVVAVVVAVVLVPVVVAVVVVVALAAAVVDAAVVVVVVDVSLVNAIEMITFEASDVTSKHSSDGHLMVVNVSPTGLCLQNTVNHFWLQFFYEYCEVLVTSHWLLHLAQCMTRTVCQQLGFHFDRMEHKTLCIHLGLFCSSETSATTI